MAALEAFALFSAQLMPVMPVSGFCSWKGRGGREEGKGVRGEGAVDQNREDGGPRGERKEEETRKRHISPEGISGKSALGSADRMKRKEGKRERRLLCIRTGAEPPRETLWSILTVRGGCMCYMLCVLC